MATRKKSVKSKNSEEIVAKIDTPVEETATEIVIDNITSETKPKKQETTTNLEEKSKKTQKAKEKTLKYPIGSIVYVSKDAQADLNGFKLFPQYKKYTYTVEAYDEITGVYSLRRLNLSLRLKEADIVAPGERAHDPLNRRQF